MRARISIVALVALALVLLCGFQRGVQVIVSPTPVSGGGKSWTTIIGSSCTPAGTSGSSCNFACTAGACTVTGLTAVTAGDLEIVAVAQFGHDSGGAALTSNAITGDSSFVHATGYPQQFGPSAGSNWQIIDVWYKLSATGGATSFTGTPTWNGSASAQAQDIQVFVAHPSTGTAIFDNANTGQSNTCTSNLCAAPSLSMSGSSDFCIQIISDGSNPPTAISGSYSGNFDSSNVFGGFARNNAVTSYSAPNWSVTSIGGSDEAQTGVVCWE